MKNIKTFKTFESYQKTELELSTDELNEWEDKLTPLFKELIDSNNIPEMVKTIGIMDGVYIKSKQFLFKKIYELENSKETPIVNNNIDFEQIRTNIKEILPNYISSFEKYYKLFKADRNKIG